MKTVKQKGFRQAEESSTEQRRNRFKLLRWRKRVRKT